MKDCIHLIGLRCFAHHGCLDEEGIIGGEFELDIRAWGDLQKASKEDDLSSTIDYVILHRVALREMKKRSALIENVAERVAQALFDEVAIIDELHLILRKINPPINGDVRHVAVEIHRYRST
jgi:dihydroneopterin aldolase